MKLLYVASDQRVPGSTGGSVHVEEVASGLSALGHEVHVVAQAGDGAPSRTYELHESAMLFHHRAFRFAGRKRVGAIIERVGADALMERYYNFGGEGVRAAHALGVPTLLEVNSPLKEPPASWKRWIDRAVLFQPMRRMRDDIVQKSTALATPLPSIRNGQVSARPRR